MIIWMIHCSCPNRTKATCTDCDCPEKREINKMHRSLVQKDARNAQAALMMIVEIPIPQQRRVSDAFKIKSMAES
jgi:hypothetical protein